MCFFLSYMFFLLYYFSSLSFISLLYSSLRSRCAASRRVSGSIPSGVTGDFFFSVATDGTMCPGVDSASKNEYQETPAGKDGRCVRVATFIEPKVKKIRSVNLPEPLGPRRPVTGHLYLYLCSRGLNSAVSLGRTVLPSFFCT
jgi:hypothetical protein